MPADRSFDPPRPVDVWHDDGRWWPGLLTHWIWAEDQWWGSVRYRVSGRGHMRSLPAARIREPLEE